MVRRILSLAVVAAVLASGSAGAAEKAKKLYRWVDKDGKVQFSDALPPEAVDQARTEINAESGMATASVEQAQTPEERAERDRRAARRSLARTKETGERRRHAETRRWRSASVTAPRN